MSRRSTSTPTTKRRSTRYRTGTSFRLSQSSTRSSVLPLHQFYVPQESFILHKINEYDQNRNKTQQLILFFPTDNTEKTNRTKINYKKIIDYR